MIEDRSVVRFVNGFLGVLFGAIAVVAYSGTSRFDPATAVPAGALALWAFLGVVAPRLGPGRFFR